MYYGLVHFPDIDTIDIQCLRQKYDPTARLIAPHITVMFPIPHRVGKNRMTRHIRHILGQWKPFPIRIRGLQKSWDHWLFLTLHEGKDRVIALYEEMYTGILYEYKRTDIPYIPHLSLGLFVEEGSNYNLKNPKSLECDEIRCHKARKEAEALNLDYRCIVDTFHLVRIADDFSSVENDEVFAL